MKRYIITNGKAYIGKSSYLKRSPITIFFDNARLFGRVCDARQSLNYAIRRGRISKEFFIREIEIQNPFTALATIYSDGYSIIVSL